MPDFVPGLLLSEAFYRDPVKAILDKDFPDLRYTAALIGSGSEVLGFDTAMSTDHHWGPRLMLFVSRADKSQYQRDIREALANQLPYTFQGYSTHYTLPNPDDNGTQLSERIDTGPVNHRVEVYTLTGYIHGYLGIDLADALNDALTPAHWLTMPAQKLRTITAGAVFHDDHGNLTRLREVLAYYPQDVWLYLLGAGWTRIAQEEPFVGRTGVVEDELGSRLISARLVHDMMNLCFLMAREYAPYSKWFGTAFAQLACATTLTPIFHAILDAPHWQVREKHLTTAYTHLARMHNALEITDPIPAQVSDFHTRPFQVIHAHRFAEAIFAHISDPTVRRIAESTHIGGVDQFSTSTDLLSDSLLTRRARALYQDN